MKSHSLIPTLCASCALSLACIEETKTVDKIGSDLILRGEVSGGDVTTASPASGFAARPIVDIGLTGPRPVVSGVAPDPTYPQKNLTIVDRTVTPRVPAKMGVDAIPGT